jgi:hypothetical protein
MERSLLLSQATVHNLWLGPRRINEGSEKFLSDAGGYRFGRVRRALRSNHRLEACATILFMPYG